MAGEILISIVSINSPLPTNQNFWSMADLSTSLSSPGVPANLPGLVFWREVQTVRYSSERQWWLGCVPLRWFRFITWGLIWPATYCLMMHCVWGVRRSRNEELIFLLTNSPNIKLSNFQLSYSCVECQEYTLNYFFIFLIVPFHHVWPSQKTVWPSLIRKVTVTLFSLSKTLSWKQRVSVHLGAETES